MPNSPNSSVKYPKKLILMEDKIKKVNGRMNEAKIKILLTLFLKSLCNSI